MFFVDPRKCGMRAQTLGIFKAFRDPESKKPNESVIFPKLSGLTDSNWYAQFL